MVNSNSQRAILAVGYKEALKGFMGLRSTLDSAAKGVSSLKSADSDGKKFLELVAATLRESAKQISTTLNGSSNRQLVDGVLFSLANQVAKDWLGDPTIVKGKAYLLDLLVQGGYVDQSYVQSLQSSISNSIKGIFKSLDTGSKSKGALHDVIRNADWKGLAGDIAGFAANLTPFGSILNEVGGFAYKAWDKQNKASFNESGPRFQENVKGVYGKDTYSNPNSGGFNGQGTGGTSNGGGGFAADIQSGVGYDPGSRRFRGVNGKYISNEAGIAGLGKDPLFVFFNKNAYVAGWTRDVLKYLKDAKGGDSGNNNPFSSLLGNLAKLLPLIGSVLAVAGTAFVAWKAGRWLGENVKWGGKTLDQHTQNLESGGFQAIDKLTGKYNFVPKERQLLDQQRGVGSMSAAQMAKLNTELRARAARTEIESPVAKGATLAGIKTTKTDIASVAVLQQLLAEIKKQNTEKKEKSTSSTSTTTQRVIHDDIGDTVAELINCSVMGQPRK